MSIYQTGTVSVTNGNAMVTGSGSAWAVSLVTGGMFTRLGLAVPIASVTDDTHLTLAYPWPGTTASGAVYSIALENSAAADIVNLNATLSRILVTLSLAGIHPNASGTLAERNAIALGTDDEGFLFLHAELGVAFAFYRWTGIAWEGPFAVANAVASGGVTSIVAGTGITVDNTNPDVPVVAMANATLPPGNDLNNCVATGFYSADGSQTNRPAGNTGNWLVIHILRSGVISTQLALSRANDDIYSRFNAGSGWGTWKRLYGQSSILGTVSQSSGVPTGAIIERGTNANGEFVKYADGTLICTFGYDAASEAWTTVSGGLFLGPSLTWTYPAAFTSNSPCVFGSTSRSGDEARGMCARNITLCKRQSLVFCVDCCHCCQKRTTDRDRAVVLRARARTNRGGLLWVWSRYSRGCLLASRSAGREAETASFSLNLRGQRVAGPALLQLGSLPC